MDLSEEEKRILEELLKCSSCGYPRSQFIKRARELDIERPMPIIRSLCKKGLMRFDQARPPVRPEGVYKPLRKAYETFGLIPPTNRR
jgi:hypothetical protein